MIGKRYWAIVTEGQLVRAYGDTAEVLPDGSLQLKVWNEEAGLWIPTVGWAPGQWTFFYAADPQDGDPLSVEAPGKQSGA